MSQKHHRTTQDIDSTVKKIMEQHFIYGFTYAEACQMFGISRSTYYRWRTEFKRRQGSDGEIAQGKRKRPKHLARQISDATKEMILEMGQDSTYPTAQAITRAIKAQGTAIGVATVIRVLREAGLYGEVLKQKANGEVVRKAGIIRRQDRAEDRQDTNQ